MSRNDTGNGDVVIGVPMICWKMCPPNSTYVIDEEL